MFYLYQDDSLRKDHQAVRTSAGWYDFTHRVIELTGPDAVAFLNFMYVSNFDNMAVGKAKYTINLDEDGWIADDCIIFRLEEEKFWISTLYTKELEKRFSWYEDDYDISYEVITDDWKMYSVQGPKAVELVNKVIDDTVDEMKFFQIKDTTLDGTPMKVARAGFTGEQFGYELYIEAEHEDALVAKLEKAGEEVGATHVTEIDVMALTLSCEAGYALGLDIRRTYPAEVGFDRMIDWKKKKFVGKKKLRKLKDEPLTRKLVSFDCPNYDAVIYGGPSYKGDPVFTPDGSKQVGRVTRFTYGYTVEKNIGFMLVDPEYAEVGTKLTCNGNELIVAEWNRLAAK